MTDRRPEQLAALKRLRAKVILRGHAVPVFLLLFGASDPDAGAVAALLELQATPGRYNAARAVERWLETGIDADGIAAVEAIRGAVLEPDLWTWVERAPLADVVKLIDRAILKGAANR